MYFQKIVCVGLFKILFYFIIFFNFSGVVLAGSLELRLVFSLPEPELSLGCMQ